MKKAEMIELVLRKEAAAYLAWQIEREEFGDESGSAITARRRWSGLYELMTDLGLVSDIMLPDNQQAIEIRRRLELSRAS
jgi:hypothetical protein